MRDEAQGATDCKGLKAGDVVVPTEDGGKTVMALPNQPEIKLRDGFPIYWAQTSNGAAIVPSDWDDFEDACYDTLA